MKINNRVRIGDIRHADLHLHTIYCDGKDSPEAMAEAAMEKGFSCIGFSGHSYVDFDPAAGMDEERLKAYIREIRRLKAVYAGKMQIFCGIELDYHTLSGPGPEACGSGPCGKALSFYTETFDYIIGSVHYIPLPSADGKGSSGYAAVDDTPQILIDAVERYYSGDYYKAAEVYYQLVADVVNRTGCDIIGHFDLFSKFNQTYQLFDEQHPGYQEAWKKAADRLTAAGKIFEINTGGMSRGWRNVPYPTPQMQDYIRRKGGSFLLSSDSHDKSSIGNFFDSVSV